MTRKAPSAKRSFIMSLTSLILCVAMLLGTTFAWFSETVSSGINTIKSGNLDVELEYYDAEAKKWTTVNGAEDIFNPDAKWEPGYTEVVYLKLSNLGSLAIKYHLGINIVDEVEGTNVAGQTFKLSNFIKYGVVEVDGENAFADRKAAIAAADPVSAALAAGYTENGHMGENGAEDDERIVAMVVYMPETVGNEANYKSGTIPPSIHLGINLIATQYTAEVDSFGPDFDENAPWTGAVDTKWYNDTDTEFVINSAEELAGLAKIVNSGTDTFEGKTVKLGKDIDLNNLPWTPIGTSESQSKKFVGSFYGNGYTISNLYVTGDKGLGLFGYSYVGAHFENITVDGAYVSGKDYVGVILGTGYLSRNCIKNCSVNDATVIATPYLTNKGVYDGGAKAGVIVGSAYNGSVIGNTATNSTVMAYRDLGGIAGMMYVDGNFTIDAYGNKVENVSLSYVTVVGVYDDNETPNQNMGSHVGRYDENKINVRDNEGKASTDTTLAFVVANDAELAIVLKQIHKDSKYWDKAIVITALANTYTGNHVINQFPEWNGIAGDGNSANNFAYGASGQHYLKLTIIGELDEEAAMPVPTTVFAGNVTVNGFGNSNAGFDTAVNTSVIFQNVAFDASNSADEEKAEDAVAIYVTAAANNVKFDTCTFANATHVTVGGSNPNGVGKIAFDKCTFNNGGCISGGAAKLDITNCVVNGADNGFINMSKATEINVSDSFVTAGKYFLRTSNSGVNLTVKNTEITMYVSEGLKHLVYFRGSSESAKFVDCKIAAGYTTYGVDADSSTLTIYNDTTENGLTLRTDGITNEVTFYKVEEDSTATTVQVPEGVTSIGGYAFAYNNNVETIVLPSTVTTINDRAFRDTTASTVILNEGITNISYQAFRNASNVKTVVIPSTVTTISKEAFQNSGITTLTIPANVNSIEYGGLRDMKELETVTIEGNVDIPVYAFRACTNLKTVYINGDNVTFGGGSRGMIFTNTENGDGSAITIYVKNEVIKARLMAADTAAKDYGGYNIVVAEQADTNGNYGGENGAPTYAYASNGDELMAHINKAVKPDVVYLSAGEHSIRFSGNYSTDVDGMTIIGSGDVKLSISSSEVTYGRIHLDNVKFENIHFVNDTVGAMGAVTYANCVFDGRLKGSSENKETYAVECTMHNIHTDGDLSSGLITLEKCTLAVAEYAKSSSNGGMKFIGCKIGEMVIWSGNTVVENCDIGKMEAHDGNYTLIVDDKYYVAGATMLNTAVAAGADTIYLLKSEFRMPGNGVNRAITIVGTEGAVIDLTWGAYWEAATLTFENVTFKTGTGMVNGNGSDYAALYSYNTTYNKCVFEGPMRLGRTGAKFVECEFTKLGNDYVWTYGQDATFEKCEFNTDGKAILIYSDGGNNVANVTVKNCVFNATTGAKAGAIANQNCAAIEIHNYGSGVNLVTEGNTMDEDFSGEWRIKTYETRLDNTAITVNGTVYAQIALDGRLMTIDANKNVTVQ